MGRKPIIVLVPGIWAGAGIWTRTVAKLHKHGYQTAVAPLVSPGRPYSATAGGPTVWDDVAAIRKVVSEAVNANGGSEVIVVMHAGGGIMGSMALKGLTRHSRKKEGLKGGVSKLAYIAALLWYLGMEWDHFDYSPDRTIVNCHNPRVLLFNDIEDDEEALRLCNELEPHTGQGYTTGLAKGPTATYFGWMDDGIQSTYLICKRDNLFTKNMQEDMSVQAGCALVEECDAGHMAPYTDPDHTVKFIRMTAGDFVT
ncbi:hypothetical protein EMMF5_001329 [Cystobasidiomycetes sp. EMM_F5]